VQVFDRQPQRLDLHVQLIPHDNYRLRVRGRQRRG
jgi:hypothetical protein